MPEVTGETEAEARATLRAAGLHAGAVTKREEPGQAPGTVLSQSPAAGSPVAGGEAVSLVVAKAPQEVTVPRVVGKKKERAEGGTRSARASPRSPPYARVSSEAEVGIVLQQTPAGGAKAKSGATVTLAVGVLGRADHPEHHPDDHAAHRAPPRRRPPPRRAGAGP